MLTQVLVPGSTASIECISESKSILDLRINDLSHCRLNASLGEGTAGSWVDVALREVHFILEELGISSCAEGG